MKQIGCQRTEEGTLPPVSYPSPYSGIWAGWRQNYRQEQKDTFSHGTLRTWWYLLGNQIHRMQNKRQNGSEERFSHIALGQRSMTSFRSCSVQQLGQSLGSGNAPRDAWRKMASASPTQQNLGYRWLSSSSTCGSWLLANIGEPAAEHQTVVGCHSDLGRCYQGPDAYYHFLFPAVPVN